MSLETPANQAVHQLLETGMSYADLLNNTDDDLLDHNFYLGRGGGVKNSRRPVFIKKPTPTRGIFPVMGFAGNLFDGYLFGFYIISYHNDL